MALFGKKKPGKAGKLAKKRPPAPKEGIKRKPQKAGLFANLFGARKDRRKDDLDEPRSADEVFFPDADGPEESAIENSFERGGFEMKSAPERMPGQPISSFPPRMDDFASPVPAAEGPFLSLADSMPEEDSEYPWNLGTASAEKTLKAAKSLGAVLKLLGLLCVGFAAATFLAAGPPAGVAPGLVLAGWVLGGVFLAMLGGLTEHATRLFVLACLATVRTERAVNRVNAGVTRGVHEVVDKMPVQEVAIDNIGLS